MARELLIQLAANEIWQTIMPVKGTAQLSLSVPYYQQHRRDGRTVVFLQTYKLVFGSC
jgi:hypothetical protein